MTTCRKPRTESEGDEDIYDDSSEVWSCPSAETELTPRIFERVAMGTMGNVSVFPLKFIRTAIFKQVT